MATPKKRKNWDPLGSDPKEYFSVKDVTDIVKKVKVPLEVKCDFTLISEYLHGAASSYFIRKKHQNMPSTPEIRAALEEFKKKAGALRQCMEDLDHVSKFNHLLFGHDYKLFEKTWSNVGLLESIAGKRINELPHGKDGRPKEDAKTAFAIELFPIFGKITGVNPYPETTTPFLYFVLECLKHINERDQSKNALKQRIHRFLKDRNNNK